MRTSLKRTAAAAAVAFVGAAVLASSTVPVAGQAFANLKSAAVDYSKADAEPRIACERLSAFKGKDVSTIQARLVPASDEAPAHCRVSGILEPEIAFEVNLPAQWN